jgi:hypothetical protein
MGFTRQVDAYSVMYSANAIPPRICLRLGTAIIGQCVFHPNGTTLPPDAQRPDGQVDLQYHLDDFQNILAVLRDGKPIFLNFKGVGAGAENAITTGV